MHACITCWSLLVLYGLARPRSYPPRFGQAIRTLFPKLISGAEGCPEINDAAQACSVFENAPFSTWDEAHLVPVLRYLRGNKHLMLPEEWRSVMPPALEILHNLEMRQLAKGQDL